MAPPKRKSPEKKSLKKKPSSPAVRLLRAAGGQLVRHPRLLIGLSGFAVVFSFVATNALWYQPKHHPAPFLATRAVESDGPATVEVARTQPADDIDTGTAGRGTRITVCGDPELLRQLDATLWTFDATAFVPHASLRAGAARPARLAPTPPRSGSSASRTSQP